MKKIKSISILIVLLTVVCLSTYSQVATNHLALSLENCSQPTANTIQFDIYAVSNGDNNSDVRANAFQIGLNFNKDILPANATVTASYVSGSTDFEDNEDFHFPISHFAGHIRIIQRPDRKGNSGNKMLLGTPYKVGTFRLSCSGNWVAGVNPDFEFQTKVDRGKTTCAGIGWLGASVSTTPFTIPGASSDDVKAAGPNSTYASDASLHAVINCSMGKARIAASQAAGETTLHLYPNPTRGTTAVSFQSSRSENYQLSILDISGKEVMVKEGKAAEGYNIMELDISRLAKGVYSVVLKTDNNSNTVRMVIE